MLHGPMRRRPLWSSLLISACVPTQASHRELRRTNDLATLTIPGIQDMQALDLGIDRVSLSLVPSSNEKKTYNKESNKVGDPVVVSAPPGEYQLSLNYFAGSEAVLSTANCVSKDIKFNLSRNKPGDVNGFPVTLCFKDQRPWELTIGGDSPDPNIQSSNQKRLRDSFATGINLAWIEFARDVGTGAPNIAEIKRQLSQVAAAGGTVARIWLHTDGSLTPEYEGSRVLGPGAYTIKDLTKILDVAATQKVQLMLTLWSFDMLRSDLKKKDAGRVTANRLLLTDPKHMRDYLDRALSPIIYAVRGHPALHSWDVINEPEGMTTAENWGNIEAADRVDLAAVQTFVNKIAGRIHHIAPSNLVTVGAVSMKYLNKNLTTGNIYSDDALVKAGKDPMGYLDFYQVHYYAKKGKENSPFQNAASSFGFDKPIYVGEFDMKEYLDFDLASPRLTYDQLKKLGYNGVLGWKDGSIQAMPLMLNAMTYLQNPAPMIDDPDLCTHFGGGQGNPFFVNETLYRKKAPDSGSAVEDWCIVE